jgi:hypothetical protein
MFKLIPKRIHNLAENLVSCHTTQLDKFIPEIMQQMYTKNKNGYKNW